MAVEVRPFVATPENYVRLASLCFALSDEDFTRAKNCIHEGSIPSAGACIDDALAWIDRGRRLQKLARELKASGAGSAAA